MYVLKLIAPFVMSSAILGYLTGIGCFILCLQLHSRTAYSQIFRHVLETEGLNWFGSFSGLLYFFIGSSSFNQSLMYGNH